MVNPLLRQSYEWIEAVSYWRGNPTPKQGDLGLAENLWAEMVQNNEDLNPVDYPEKSIDSPPDNPDVYALIQSHLFCVDNLDNDEIRNVSTCFAEVMGSSDTLLLGSFHR